MPEPMWKVDTCDTCHRPIIWTVTTNAKAMPVDAEPPSSGGNIALESRGDGVPPLARVLSVAKQFGRTNLRLSHFATCPQADRHRQRRPSRRAVS